MGVSPFRRRLYLTAGWAAICLLTGLAVGQGAKPSSASKGPRALGLLELAPNGKAHLIPVAILDEGQFYDASAYKASPVPMALDSGTVYEAMKTGISQGLFTVSAAGHLGQAWIGQGTWRAAGSEPPKKVTDTKPREEVDAPPKLHRSGTEPKPDEAKPEENKSSPPTPAAQPAPPPASASAPPPSPPPPAEDKDHPVLRRGKPAPQSEEEEPVNVATPLSKSSSKPATGVASPGIQLIPAISDAAGPEPRPYTYDLKPDEQAQFQKKMLALADDEVRTRMKELAPAARETSAARNSAGMRRTASAPQQLTFDNVQLRVLDLSNSNEPVAVLSAEARPPSSIGGTADRKCLVTIVARENIYGELHKAFAEVTDAQHLDVLPRMDFIDAVDADGDGRGELLFRRVYDTGSAFTIYRVIGDRVWPLFEGIVSK